MQVAGIERGAVRGNGALAQAGSLSRHQFVECSALRQRTAHSQTAIAAIGRYSRRWSSHPCS